MAGLLSRVKRTLKHSWNVFLDDNYTGVRSFGGHESTGYYYSPSSRSRSSYSSERSIISSIYTRLGIDVAGVDIRHVRTDDEGRFLEDMDSGLQDCLQVEPNIDQGARQFRQDIAMTLFEHGTAAIVPVETDINPSESASYIIRSLRVGEIVAWHPRHVTVSLYDDRVGQRKQVTVEKKYTAIVENPLYSVMNEPNSTLKRLIHKLNMLDSVDEQSSSGKLDMIIQLPYVIKSEARRQQAEQRRKDIEHQLKGSQYGIAYTDGTEKITQLNRPVENNLLKQIEYLTGILYAQLGLTEEVMNGTADEKAMLNYFSRTIEPVVQAISEAMKKTFLTKTARSQKQSIMYFRDPFKLVPMEQIAEIADKFTRNEVLSANEIRQGIGFKPSKDPKADQLVNSNMPQAGGPAPPGDPGPAMDAEEEDLEDEGEDLVQSGIAEANAMIDSMLQSLGVE
ncbi:portal protein [Streptomyces phage Esketit]|uniref:Portal protein n=6 Tax=Rimavirus rima TaxID=2560784 RepID=A0A515MIL9_9CAUD|nr:portal protein [Streptomyces phage Spectropatronm]QDM56513.1 portal protein [Streptomyces phage Esketit]QEQ93791.1 portal protein [Streptomyces phage CherryBlossom]QEQ93960.1 portal protein [Streptomyces phage Meibysrarus]QEQ94229.1 portal protein [Streptomyces phage Hoshi]QPX62039.1 portal protein [Streptomyces phage Indigenous]